MMIKPPKFILPNRGHKLFPDAGLWLMNEGSGNKVFDLSGNGNIGTFQGNISWSPGKFGPAINNPGDAGDYISVANNSLLNFTTAFSWSIWICPNFTQADGTARGIFCKTEGNTEAYRLLFVAGIDNFRFRAFNAGGSDNCDTQGKTWSAGEWIHLAGTYDNVNLKIYYNGVLDNTVALAGPLTTGSDNLSIARAGTTDEWLGKIDNFSFYNYASTDSEIALLYREPFCISEREPIELWSAATLGAAPPAGIPILRRRRESA